MSTPTARSHNDTLIMGSIRQTEFKLEREVRRWDQLKQWYNNRGQVSRLEEELDWFELSATAQDGNA